MSRALAASPAGDVIGRGVQSASDHIAGSLLSIGINPTRAYYATIGAIALGTLAFGATKAIKYVRQTADEIANLRTPLAPEFSDFDQSNVIGNFLSGPNRVESRRHALEVGPREGIIDRAGAAQRRRDNLKGVPIVPKLDRDEFPPAAISVTDGLPISVKVIPRSDNRSSGAAFRHEITNLPDGTRVLILPPGD